MTSSNVMKLLIARGQIEELIAYDHERVLGLAMVGRVVGRDRRVALGIQQIDDADDDRGDHQRGQ